MEAYAALRSNGATAESIVVSLEKSETLLGRPCIIVTDLRLDADEETSNAIVLELDMGEPVDIGSDANVLVAALETVPQTRYWWTDTLAHLSHEEKLDVVTRSILYINKQPRAGSFLIVPPNLRATV